jgi:uncharacterized protein YuzE
MDTSYDDIADVLYVTVGESRPLRYEEDEQGFVWRIDNAGRAYGVTIFDYCHRWANQSHDLARRLSAILHVDATRLSRAIQRSIH